MTKKTVLVSRLRNVNVRSKSKVTTENKSHHEVSPVFLLGSRPKVPPVGKKNMFTNKMHGKGSLFRHSLTSAWRDFVRKICCIDVIRSQWPTRCDSNQFLRIKHIPVRTWTCMVDIKWTYQHTPSIQLGNMTWQDLTIKWSHLKTQSNVHQVLSCICCSSGPFLCFRHLHAA